MELFEALFHELFTLRHERLFMVANLEVPVPGVPHNCKIFDLSFAAAKVDHTSMSKYRLEIDYEAG